MLFDRLCFGVVAGLIYARGSGDVLLVFMFGGADFSHFFVVHFRF